MLQTLHLTSSLEVERHHVTATHPQWIRVIVGGVHPLAFRIDAAQSLAVIQHELSQVDSGGCLILYEGAHLFVGIVILMGKKIHS